MTAQDKTWKPGENIDSPVSDMISIDPSTQSPTENYKLIIGAIIPRPIAFISTVDTEGHGNLAPFSYFNAVSSNPPCLAVAFGFKPDKEKKDTLRNIEATQEFVVNSANEWLAEPLTYSAGDFPAEVNEMEAAGLTPIASEIVRAPRVKEAAIHFECKLYDSLQIGDGSTGSTTLVIGQIVRFHIFKEAYHEGKILHEKVKPIGRLGGSNYTRVNDIFSIERPKSLK